VQKEDRVAYTGFYIRHVVGVSDALFCLAETERGCLGRRLIPATTRGEIPDRGVDMTKLLAQAFEKASELSDDLQDQLARELLEELEWEARWEGTLEVSQAQLEKLAEKAMQAYRAGETKEMGFDDL